MQAEELRVLGALRRAPQGEELSSPRLLAADAGVADADQADGGG